MVIRIHVLRSGPARLSECWRNPINDCAQRQLESSRHWSAVPQIITFRHVQLAPTGCQSIFLLIAHHFLNWLSRHTVKTLKHPAKERRPYKVNDLQPALFSTSSDFKERTKICHSPHQCNDDPRFCRYAGRADAGSGGPHRVLHQPLTTVTTTQHTR